MAIAPDGTWLASASDDRTVRIWDPTTGADRHTLTGHTDAVRAVAIARTSRWPVRVCRSVPVVRSQIRTVWSPLAEASQVPSGATATAGPSWCGR